MVERLRALEEKVLAHLEKCVDDGHIGVIDRCLENGLSELCLLRQLRADYEEDELVTLLLESNDIPEKCFAKTDLVSCEHGFDCVCNNCSA